MFIIYVDIVKNNVNRRLCEVDLLTGDLSKLKREIQFIHETLQAFHENGEDAIFERFDISYLDENGEV